LWPGGDIRKLPFFKEVSGPCRGCAKLTEHRLSFGRDGHLHSKCLGCQKDVLSFAPTALVVGERRRPCTNCVAVTDQFQYESREGHLYTMCSSCGAESTAE
jgi:hypothetical protein